MDDDDPKTMILVGVGALIFIVALFFLLGGAGLFWNRVASPYEEETRKQTYDTSRQYEQGMNRDILLHCRSMRAANGAGRKAEASYIIGQAGTFNGKLNSEAQACVSEAQGN